MSLLLLLGSQASIGTWGRVQKASNGANAANTIVTLGATPTVGNLLVAWANSDATVTMGGSGWTAGPSVIDGNGAYFWWKVAAAAEPAAVTFTPSISDYICAGLIEYSGNIASPFDVSSSSTISGGGTTSTTPVSVTTTATSDLGVALAALHQGGQQAEPTGVAWTGSYNNQQSQGIGGGATKVYSWYADNLNLGVPGSTTTGSSWTGNWGDAQELVMTFKVGSAVPVVLPRPVLVAQSVRRASTY